MADSDEIVGQRQTFYVGDVNYKTALSEALMRKFASSNNFINGRIVDIYPTHFGGYFRAQSTNGFNEPTIYILKNTTVSWYTLSIGQTGSAGNNSCNFKVIDTSGSIAGDLFSTAPIINQAGLSSPTIGRNFKDNTTIQQVTTTGFNLGVLNPAFATLTEGYSLRPYIVGNSTNSLGMTLTLALDIQE